MNISLAAEPVFYLWGFKITNSLISTWIVITILFFIGYIVGKRAKIKPDSGQNLFEIVFQAILDLSETVAGQKSRVFFPLIFTFFIFIICANWFGLLPGVGSIGLKEVIDGKEVFVPFLRAATSDLNMTLALSLISVFTIQYYGVKYLKLSYFKKFINITSPINFFVGILELISEFSKIISFSFRLFGNIFSGEVLLMVIAFLVPMIGSLPFFGLEIFVGFIQALVFMMLTLVFINVATVNHEEH